MSVISPTEAGCAWSFPFHPVGRWRVRDGVSGSGSAGKRPDWEGAAALALTSDHGMGGKGGPDTPASLPGRYVLEIYKCSSDVFGKRLLDLQGNLVRK